MRARASLALSLAFGLAAGGATVSGCGGGGGGGGGGGQVTPPPTGGFTSLGLTQEIRPDLLLGSSVPPVSLQDQRTHVYRFPGIPGTTYTIELDTLPSTRQVRLDVVEAVTGGQTLLGLNVTTPFTTQVTVGNDVPIDVRIFDFNQGGVTLNNLRVRPAALPFNQNRFGVFIHLCGDSFAGLGINNDLATSNDQVAFANALINGVNSVLPSAEVAIDPAASGVGRLTNAQVAAVDPSLVVGGFTVLPNTVGQEDNLSQLGIPASDPNWGFAADVFLVHSPNPGFPEGTGQCDCVPAGQGGVFRGVGPDHSLFLRLFDAQGQPRTLAEIQNTLAHELGHFLSLRHPTEASFATDDLLDTPFSTVLAQDGNGNGSLDPFEATGPDATNVMFLYSGNKTVWTVEQRNAMRAYLGLREH